MNMTESKTAMDYARDGFVFPLDILSEADAGELRARSGAGARRNWPMTGSVLLRRVSGSVPVFFRPPDPPSEDGRGGLGGARAGCHGLGLRLFIKEANTPSFVSWHQDLTYWGLDKAEETTLWVALSPTTQESGCMRFIPGSHRERIVPHADSFAAGQPVDAGTGNPGGGG